MTTNMETERLRPAVKEMAGTVLKMAEISQADEEWRKETASAIGLTAELAIRMLAAGDAEERTRSEALFWTSFLAGKGDSLLPEYWQENAGMLLSWAESGTNPDGSIPSEGDIGRASCEICGFALLVAGKKEPEDV